MKVAGIIAEYNPFHNGHQFHIEETRRQTGADYVIAVMSGNFVQRGAPAFLPKEHRTRMALLGGADLVLELPMPFATASAEDFAFWGVSMLESCGVVDFLSFGCETENLSLLSQLADLCLEEPPLFREVLQKGLKDGLSFPRARQAAMEACLPDLSSELLSQPNLILGIEYLKALKKLESSISPLAVPRCDKGYHSGEALGTFASASAVRSLCLNHEGSSCRKPVSLPSEAIRDFLPAESLQLLETYWNHQAPVEADDLSQALGYALLACRNGDLTRYEGISPELSRRIINHLTAYESFSAFGELLKTKSYTRTRIDRALLHLLFSVTGEDMARWKAEGPSYLRILGLRKSAGPLIKELKERPRIPLLERAAGYEERLSPTGRSLFEKDLLASHLYRQLLVQKFGTQGLKDEFRRPLVIV